MMKKIIVPMAIGKMGQDKEVFFHGARETYIKKCVHYRLLPLFVSALMPKEMINVLYNESDGMLFMGGSDFDPVYYHEKKEENTSIAEPERDHLELYLLKKALQDKKPFLGICRGHQALAIASGGTLIQHIVNHSVGSYDALLNGPVHEITINKGSKLHSIIKKDRIRVNSAHHQAVNNPGENMQIAALSTDGIIEAIEHVDRDYFCFGVQCHPEVEKDGAFEKLLAEFARSL